MFVSECALEGMCWYGVSECSVYGMLDKVKHGLIQSSLAGQYSHSNIAFLVTRNGVCFQLSVVTSDECVV